MKDYKEFFKGKRITMLGLGVLGRGVGDAEFLTALVKELVVTDTKSREELAASLERLQKFSNIKYTLGEHTLKDFRDVDMVIKAAGVPRDSPYIAEAKKHNIPVRMSADLLVELAGVKTVGVTGTRGKSTVVHLIAHTLRQAGRHVLLGGNVRGVSNLALLPEVRSDTILVLELDSWQLQGFGEAKISPNIAVFTNFMPDHLNYYKGDPSTTALRAGYGAGMDAYFADKTNIFKFQKPKDVFIAGASIVEQIRASVPPLDPIVPELIPRGWKLRILGEHNRENASFAKAALSTLEIPEEEIKAGIESFKGVEGRLQFVREVSGVKIYNDNNATTPEATVAALLALNDNTILIAGGTDKGLDMSEFVSEVKRKCKKVVLLAGSGTDKIKTEFPGASVFDSLDEATNDALKGASRGDNILFSPAFASFGMFKNEYDRNDQFMQAVAKL